MKANLSNPYQMLDPRFRKCVIPTEPLECLWTGGRWTEGPVYSSSWRSLVWSDIPNDNQWRLDELTGKVGLFRSGQGSYANGATIDSEGRLVICQHGTRSVIRIEHDGSTTALASRFKGDRLNSPNDVVVASDGGIWFSDPVYGIRSAYEGLPAKQEIEGQHVYRICPHTFDCVQVTNDFFAPNGLAFSCDESRLYIVESGDSYSESTESCIRAFSVSQDFSLDRGSIFTTCQSGAFDGIRIDTEERIWASAADGVYCYDSDGSLLGIIHVPEEVSNLCFGGPKRNRLFITATSSLYSVVLHVQGQPLKRTPRSTAIAA